MSNLYNLCICGGPAYECAHCNEKRCMTCGERTGTDEIKTCVQWCPEHREMGRLGLLEPDIGRIHIVPCTFCGSPSGHPCLTSRYEDYRDYGYGKLRVPHPQRVDLAKIRGVIND